MLLHTILWSKIVQVEQAQLHLPQHQLLLLLELGMEA